jgi:hypothetical protein
VHMLAKVCGVSDDLFNIDNVVMPTMNKDTNMLIDSIKKLYHKRDTVDIKDYDVDCMKSLYKFMLDHLMKKLKLFKSEKSKKYDDSRDSIKYTLNEDNVAKYNRLKTLMCTHRNDEYTEEE